MRKVLCLMLLGLAIVSCNKSADDIEKSDAKGVVLVQNQSYYEVVLPNGESLYFSSYDKEDGIQGLVGEEDSVEVTCSYGTGFFISKQGEIVTNDHVVSNIAEDEEVNESLSDVIDALKEVVAIIYNEYDEKLTEVQKLYDYANYSSDVSYEEFYEIRDYRDQLQNEMNEYLEYYTALDDLNADDSEIKYHNRVSIAYNNTYVTEASDFISCVVVNTDPEHDLAVLQLKDKRTPDDIYIFKVPDNDPLEDYSLADKIAGIFGGDKNEKLYMTGYNLGPTLALTDEGIKSQFNNGTVSQRTSDEVMYSIPALPGSSGSPVVNKRGELVAVNYAGLNSTQSFNYGIRIKHLRALLGL